MKMSALFASLLVVRPVASYLGHFRRHAAPSSRLFSVSSAADIQRGVSRMEILQKLLFEHGAPGSEGCKDKQDLQPIASMSKDTPELIASIMGDEKYADLHPHLYPIAKSEKTGHVICALRRAFSEGTSSMYETSSNSPWPIVESKIGGPGMKLLALNSEHLMRRIACENDFKGDGSLVDVYNDGLGKQTLADAALDVPYERGSVEKLGYGVDKYVLLKVAPFSDIYEKLALDHKANGDESSSLTAAEVANSKISGFGSTFLFYSQLLSTFPNRVEEARDAARMCLRLPIPSIGLTTDSFKAVAVLGELATEGDSVEHAMEKIMELYEKIREHEKDDPQANQGKTPETSAIDEANYVIDKAALTGTSWSSIRPRLAEIYNSVGLSDMAHFVNPS